MRIIDADALIADLDKGLWGKDWDKALAKAIIRDAPTIDAVEVVHGEWKRRLVDNGFNADWVCSECGYRVKTDFVSFNFCPNCGARMKGASDERI